MSTSLGIRSRTSNPSELGRALARARQAAGLTQEAMAAELGIHRSYLARMECGLATEQIKRMFGLLRFLDLELAIVEREDPGGWA